MDGLFRYDGAIMKYLTRLGNLMLVSILWMVCCLPVITIVPACAALYHTVSKVIRGTGDGVFLDFLKTLKRNFKQGVILELLIIVTAAVLYFCLMFGYQNVKTTLGGIYFGVGCLVAVVWAATVIHIPPALSRFEGSVMGIVRISVYLALSQLVRSAFAALLLAFLIWIIDTYPLIMIILPGMYTDLICTGMERRMLRLMKLNGYDEDGDKEEDLVIQDELPEDSALSMAAMLEEDEDSQQHGENEGEA